MLILVVLVLVLVQEVLEGGKAPPAAPSSDFLLHRKCCRAKPQSGNAVVVDGDVHVGSVTGLLPPQHWSNWDPVRTSTDCGSLMLQPQWKLIMMKG